MSSNITIVFSESFLQAKHALGGEVTKTPFFMQSVRRAGAVKGSLFAVSTVTPTSPNGIQDAAICFYLRVVGHLYILNTTQLNLTPLTVCFRALLVPSFKVYLYYF